MSSTNSNPPRCYTYIQTTHGYISSFHKISSDRRIQNNPDPKKMSKNLKWALRLGCSHGCQRVVGSVDKIFTSFSCKLHKSSILKPRQWTPSMLYETLPTCTFVSLAKTGRESRNACSRAHRYFDRIYLLSKHPSSP